ncbi:MAG: ATPase [Alphaproteobacteria bacterium]|nr:ATPase [Alphaproteobacteria bacterium]
MTTHRPKRFYAEVTLSAEHTGFSVLLDGKRLSTPGGAALIVPVRSLAEAVAAEWRAQDEYIDTQTMPIARLVNTALERIPQTRISVIDQLLEYGRHDLLCYRADTPQSLSTRQAEQWQPLLDWLKSEYCITLKSTAGIVPIAQSDESIAALKARLAQLDDFALAGVFAATTLTGSLVLALALHTGRIEAAEAFSLATLDETFQAEHWGADAEAEARLKRIASELSAVAQFLRLAGGTST